VSHDGRTVVVAVAVLLPGFGSVGDVAVTDAVFVIVPFAGDLTTIVTVAEVPLTRSPSAQVTSAFEGFALHTNWRSQKAADLYPSPRKIEPSLD
jgi:hypothetical protein